MKSCRWYGYGDSWHFPVMEMHQGPDVPTEPKRPDPHVHSRARKAETLNFGSRKYRSLAGEPYFPTPPPPACISYALVQATVGVGTVLIWDLLLVRYQT